MNMRWTDVANGKTSMLAGAFIALVFSSPVWAEDELVLPCQSERYHDFDFIIGEWDVFDFASGEQIARDTIIKDIEGCALIQNWRQIDDRFRREGVPYRMRGTSLSSFDGRGWIQIWSDNMGSSIALQGGVEDGDMVLRSQRASHGTFYYWRWAPQEDGTVKNQGYFSDSPDGPWKDHFEIIYQPRKTAE